MHGLVTYPVDMHGLVTYPVDMHGLVTYPVDMHGLVTYPVDMHGLVTYPVDMLGSSSCSKHTKYTSPTSDIEDNLASKQVLVVVDGVSVGQSSYLVLQHFFMNT